jgi:hypothetical protein
VPKSSQVAVRVAEIRLHAATDRSCDFRPSDVLAGVQRLLEGDAHAALEQDRQLRLLSDGLQQLEVLRVAGSDLEHHPGCFAGLRERLADLLDVGFVGDLHRDDPDPVLSGQLEDEGKAGGPVSLEVVGACARLVGSGSRGDDPALLERGEHRLGVLVSTAHRPEEMEAVLADADPLLGSHRLSPPRDARCPKAPVIRTTSTCKLRRAPGSLPPSRADRSGDERVAPAVDLGTRYLLGERDQRRTPEIDRASAQAMIMRSPGLGAERSYGAPPCASILARPRLLRKPVFF